MKNIFAGASLGMRVVSAVIGLAALVGVGYRFGAVGLSGVAALASALVVREYVRIAFHPAETPPALRWWFVFVSLMLFLALWTEAQPLLVYAVATSIFFAGAIWLTRNRVRNEVLLPALSMSSVGFLYCVVFPMFSIYTLRLPHGIAWFELHLIVVFFGDIFAYFGGIAFGNKKLMPEISPKKTWAGAVAGLLGSVLGGVAFDLIALRPLPVWQIFLFAVICGFTAQMGDLFVSLFKRVAHVKDSGTLMPGHGGLLDRLDGVLITCPLIYAFALWAEQFL